MWKLLIVCIVAVLTMNSEARNQKRNANGYAGANAGSYSGSNGAGYNGGYDDYDYGYAPDFGFMDPLLFHQQLTAQILANHAAQNRQIQQQIAQQQAYFHNLNRHNYNNVASGGNYGPSNRYAPNHAVAAASIGPGGSYHTASINPENPAIPNISNRFGEPSSPGGFKGVSVSSFSSSSDVNGQKANHRGAQTTINDNGKVTTYRVQS